MNEAETRAEHIDPALKGAGWGAVEGSRVMREYRITEGRLQGAGQRAKPEIADYVLVYRNHKLAVVEAKRWDLPHTEGLAQAKSYADKLRLRFTYATNGQRIYGVDMQSGVESDVAAYPTPEELWRLTFASTGSATDPAAAERVEAWRERFAAVPFEDKGGLWGARYYQDSAVNNVLEAIAANKQRILLTLATGTGKTFIAFQLAWKLFHARWNLKRDAARRPRILFLADRNILADQAYNSFSAFPEESNWRGILDYFAPAVQLGLTATPKRRDNADTYAYFGEPVYVYSLKEGINDGFLTPFRVKQYATTLDEYRYTSDDNLIEGEIEAGKLYEEKDFNRIIEIEAREKYRVKLFMEAIN